MAAPDIVERSRELDRQILAIPEDQVFTKRVVFTGFCVLTGLLLVILGLVVGITLDTNRAVERQVAPLQARVLELEQTVSAQDSVITQSVDAILQLQQILRDNGIEPPEIVIRPPEPDTPG